MDKVKKDLAIIAIHKWRLGLKSKKAAAPAATVTAPDPSPQPSYMLIDHHLTEKMYKTFGGPWIDEYINNNTQIEFGKIKEQINHLNLDGFKDWFDNTDINLFSQESNAHFFVDAYYACEIVKMIKSIKTNDTEIIGTILTGITTPEQLETPPIDVLTKNLYEKNGENENFKFTGGNQAYNKAYGVFVKKIKAINTDPSDSMHSRYEIMRLYYNCVYEASKKVRSVLNFRLNYENTEEKNKKEVTRLAKEEHCKMMGLTSSNDDLHNQYVIFDNFIQNNRHRYGEYKQVLGGEISKYIVEEDDVEIDDDSHYIYAGYGFSGSGKSHTLITDTHSILNQIKNKIKEAEAEAEAKTWTMSVCDLYGESIKGDPFLNNKKYKSQEENITYYLKNGDNNVIKKKNIQIGTDKKDLEIEVSSGFNFDDFFKKLTEFRKQAKHYYETDEDEYKRYRVRATTNNSESSRAHLFITFYKENKPKYTIIDMGGSEDVDEIQNQYFTKGVQYDLDKINKSLKTNIGKIKTYLGVFSTLRSQARSCKISDRVQLTLSKKFQFSVKGYAQNTFETLNKKIKDIKPIELIEKKNEESEESNEESDVHEINHENWMHFIANSHEAEKDNLKEEYAKFVQRTINYKTYQYKEIISKFEDLMLYDFGKTEQEFIPYFNKLMDALIEPLNMLLQRVLLDGNNKYSVTYAFKENNIVPTVTLTDNSGTVRSSEDRIKYLTNKIYKKLISKFTNLGNLEQTFLQVLTTLDNSFIEHYHYPLRAQGNYIKESIETFKQLSKDVNNSKLSELNVDHNIYKLLNITKENINHKKLVIFTCLRLDKYVEVRKQNPCARGSGSVGECTPDKLRENLKIIRDVEESLKFSHCINPVRDKTLQFYSRDKTEKKADLICTKGGGVRTKYNGGSSNMVGTSGELQWTCGPWLMELMKTSMLLYGIKICRWSYYSKIIKATKNDDEDDESGQKNNIYNVFFVDYCVTVMLAIVLHASKLDTLMYNLLFDEVATLFTVQKTGDLNGILYPYFIVSHLILTMGRKGI